MPLYGFGIARHQTLEMREGIFFCPRRSPGGIDHLSVDDIELDEPGHRAMPNILEFAPQHVARLHGQVRMFALQGFHAGQLIHTDGALSLLGPLRGTCIHLTPLDNLLVALHIGHFCQPIPEAVRLEAPFLSSRAACRGEICSMMPRAFTSSASSRPVHWLIG